MMQVEVIKEGKAGSNDLHYAGSIVCQYKELIAMSSGCYH